MTEKEPRCYLFSPDCPSGKIFTGADAIDGALDDGWVDNPADVAKPKGKAKSGSTGGKGNAANANK